MANIIILGLLFYSIKLFHYTQMGWGNVCNWLVKIIQFAQEIHPTCKRIGSKKSHTNYIMGPFHFLSHSPKEHFLYVSTEFSCGQEKCNWILFGILRMLHYWRSPSLFPEQSHWHPDPSVMYRQWEAIRERALKKGKQSRWAASTHIGWILTRKWWPQTQRYQITLNWCALSSSSLPPPLSSAGMGAQDKVEGSFVSNRKNINYIFGTFKLSR